MSQSLRRRRPRESIATIHRALDLGITFLDTSDMYGDGHNEELVGAAIAGRRDEVQLATKFSLSARPTRRRPDRRPARSTCGPARGQPAPAGRRRDRPLLPAPGRPDVPIEDTVGAMAELVEQGKVRYLGLSEAGAGDAAPGGRRPPDRGAAERVVAVDPRHRGRGRWASPVSSASASCRTARSAAASSPARSPAATDFAEDDFRRGHPASRARTSRRTCGWSRRCASWPTEKGVTRRRSSRWRGCSPRVTTSCRSRAPSGAATSRRTSAAAAVELPPTTSPGSRRSRRPGVPRAPATPTRRYAYGDSPEKACAMSADPLGSARPPAGRGLRLAGADVLLRFGADLGFRTVLVEPDAARVPSRAGRAVPRLRRARRRAGRRHRRRRRHRPPPRRARRAAARRAGPARPLDRRDGQPPARGPAHRGADRARGAAGGDRPGAPADRAGHRLHGTPAEIAVSTLAGLLADRNGRPGGFAHARLTGVAGRRPARRRPGHERTQARRARRRTATVVAEAESAYAVEAPRPGWAETGRRLGRASTTRWRRCSRRSPAARVRALGLAGQMHGAVVVDAAGAAAAAGAALARPPRGRRVGAWRALPAADRAALANPLVPGMTGPMLAWLAANEPAVVGRAAAVAAAQGRPARDAGPGAGRSPTAATPRPRCSGTSSADGWSRPRGAGGSRPGCCRRPAVGRGRREAAMAGPLPRVPVVVGRADTPVAMLADRPAGRGRVNLGTGAQVLRPGVPTGELVAL